MHECVTSKFTEISAIDNEKPIPNGTSAIPPQFESAPIIIRKYASGFFKDF